MEIHLRQQRDHADRRLRQRQKEQRKRPARMGRNPATGEQIKIKASKKVAFRPLKELKEAI